MQIKNNMLQIRDIINKPIIILTIQTTSSSYVRKVAITFLNSPYYRKAILLYFFNFCNRKSENFFGFRFGF